MKNCTIIVLSFNGRDLLAEGLPSIIEAVQWSGGSHEIMVVDNGSTDDSVEFVRRTFPKVTLLPLDQNYRFVGGNNRGICKAKNDIVVLLNNDMVVEKDFLNPLLKGFVDDSIFAVTSQIYFQDQGKRREETGKTGFYWERGMLYACHQVVDDLDAVRQYVPILWAGGGSAAYDKRKFADLGLFDELYLPCYVDDLDISYVAWKRGWKSVFCAESIVHHKHRATHVKQFSSEELETIIQRHYLFFMWKNLSVPYLLTHFTFLPLHVIKQLVVERKSVLLKAVLSGFMRVDKVIKSRLTSRPTAVVTDRQILNRQYIKKSFEFRKTALRILIVCPYIPCMWAHAGANRMYKMIEGLAKVHSVTVLTYYDEQEQKQHVADLERFCAKVVAIPRGQSLEEPNWFHTKPDEFIKEFANRRMKQTIHDELFATDFDVVQFEYLQMAFMVDIARKFNVLCIFTEIEVQARKLWRDMAHMSFLDKTDHFVRWMKMLNFENQICSRCDAVIALTREDAAFVKRYNRNVPVSVSPMGIDTEFFKPTDAVPDYQSLLFIGYFRHTPNVEAMLFFVKEILPQVRRQFPNVKLFIVGGEAPQELIDLGCDPNVVVTGRVGDVRPYYQRSEIFIAPLRLGTGMRGKVLEAWAMKRPVITTTVGAEGYDCEHGRELMIADDSKSFADCVIELLSNPQLRTQIAERGFQRAKMEFAWSHIADQYEALYYNLLGEKNAD